MGLMLGGLFKFDLLPSISSSARFHRRCDRPSATNTPVQRSRVYVSGAFFPFNETEYLMDGV